MNFEITTTGKWILAGEHAVLRGVSALVFPLRGKKLNLSFIKDQTQDLTLNFSGERGEEFQLLFWGVLERALEICKVSRSQIHGKVSLSSNVPIGAGLGASASLCVAIGRWFNSLGFVQEEELYDFCRQLENLFHGESSGVDIAVTLNQRGLHFERSGGVMRSLDLKWQPKWYVSYTGQRGMTSECVAKVKKLHILDPLKAKQIDEDMAQAVRICEKALTHEDSDMGFKDLVSGIELAQRCFKLWGLSEGLVSHHMKMLSEAGARAVKPTGSGDGGYVLSLWDSEPPEALREQLITC